jgi:hypothetical protein
MESLPGLSPSTLSSLIDRNAKARQSRVGFLVLRDNSVYRRIESILGVHLNRSELISLVSSLKLIPLTREEKRVKSLLIAKLEDQRDTLLPLLETRLVIASLEKAYASMARRTECSRALRAVNEVRRLPLHATVEFYLNRPGAATDRWN